MLAARRVGGERQVETGAEAPPGTGQDQDAAVRVAGHLLQQFPDQLDGLIIQRIEPVGPVETQ